MKKIIMSIVAILLLLLCGWIVFAQIQMRQIATQISPELNEAATELSPMMDIASYGMGTPIPDGQLSVVNSREVLGNRLDWFIFTDMTLNGHPAVMTKVNPEEGQYYSKELREIFTAFFIGDPVNLDAVKIILPYTDSAEETPILDMFLADIFSSATEERQNFLDWKDKFRLNASIGSKEEKMIVLIFPKQLSDKTLAL